MQALPQPTPGSQESKFDISFAHSLDGEENLTVGAHFPTGDRILVIARTPAPHGLERSPVRLCITAFVDGFTHDHCRRAVPFPHEPETGVSFGQYRFLQRCPGPRLAAVRGDGHS